MRKANRKCNKPCLYTMKYYFFNKITQHGAEQASHRMVWYEQSPTNHQIPCKRDERSFHTITFHVRVHYKTLKYRRPAVYNLFIPKDTAISMEKISSLPPHRIKKSTIKATSQNQYACPYFAYKTWLGTHIPIYIVVFRIIISII